MRRCREISLPHGCPHADTLYSYFHSIANMMIAFTELAVKVTRPVPLKDTILLNRVVLAGIDSREKGGARIDMDKFMADLD